MASKEGPDAHIWMEDECTQIFYHSGVPVKPYYEGYEGDSYYCDKRATNSDESTQAEDRRDLI